MKSLISIIILNYNKYSNTINCLKSLREQTYQYFEVFIVDNGSNLEYFLKLRRELKQFDNNLKINLIRSKINLYFAAGNNKAIKQARGEYICLLNDDIITTPDFLEKMLKFLENHPDAGMISPKIKLFKFKNFIWYSGAEFNFKNPFIVKIRGIGEYDPKNQKYSKISKTGFAAGTALFMKRKVIDDIGLMDDIFFMYQEDPDWNIRAKKRGYKSYYVPTTIVYHNLDLILKKNRIFFRGFLIRRNSQIFVWKHAKFKQILSFYLKFISTNLNEIVRLILFYENRKTYLLYLHLISIWQGFRIGIRRRTNRSCRKYLIKDYNFIIEIQRTLNSYVF